MFPPRLIVPTLLILATGMGLGSIHNAQARGALPGLDAPLGVVLILLTLLAFVCAVLVFRHYDSAKAIGYRLAMGAAVVGALIQWINFGLTMATEGSLSGWLVHEYLGLIASTLIFVQLFWTRPNATVR